MFASIASACGPSSTPASPVTRGLIAIALPTTGAARLSAYVGDGNADPLVLPSGTYVVEMADSADHVKRLENVTAGRLVLPASIADAPSNTTRAKDLRSLARFALGADAVRLTILAQLSAGYAKPLFDRSVRYDHGLAVTLADQSKLVVAELDRAVAALDRTAASGAGPLVASVNGAPRAGILSGIKDKLTGFAQALVRPGQNSRERIKKLGAAIKPADKRAALDAVRPDLRFGATSWDEFLGKLDQVPWYEMAQLENALRNDAPGYGQEAQDAGATTAQIAFTEGANMLTKGAELNVAVLKTVLIGAFPDIGLGFDYAKKADEYATYVQKLYREPLRALEDTARDEIKSRIADRIKNDIKACCPEVSPDFVADLISQRVMDAIPLVIATASPTPTRAAGSPAAPSPSTQPRSPAATAAAGARSFVCPARLTTSDGKATYELGAQSVRSDGDGGVFSVECDYKIPPATVAYYAVTVSWVESATSTQGKTWCGAPAVRQRTPTDQEYEVLYSATKRAMVRHETQRVGFGNIVPMHDFALGVLHTAEARAVACP